MSEIFVYRSRMPASSHEVYRWHARADALRKLTPPWEKVQIVVQTGGIEEIGSRVKIRVGIGPFSQYWVSEHTTFEKGRMFRDELVSGPFRRWVHTHLFLEEDDRASYLEDRVEYEVPLGRLGRLLARGYIESRLKRMFAWRHKVTAEALEAERQSKSS